MVAAQPADIRTGKPNPRMKGEAADCLEVDSVVCFSWLTILKTAKQDHQRGCIGEIRLGTAVSSSSSRTGWAGWREEVQKPAAGAAGGSPDTTAQLLQHKCTAHAGRVGIGCVSSEAYP